MTSFKTLLAAVVAMLFSVQVLAADEVYHKKGIALKGYDVVAYYSLNEGEDGIKGSEEFSTEHEGFTYRFASKENLDKFTADPNAYLPQFGGWCVYGLANAEKKVNVDPKDAWTVYNGKLYLNNSGAYKRFLKEKDDNIARAQPIWSDIKHKEK